MIKRILNPDEFCQAIDDLDSLFQKENEEHSHLFVRHDKESIKASFANKYLLAWDVFVWANKEDDKYDAIGVFINDKSVKFNEPIFTEFLWLSKNPRAGMAILKTAVGFARENEFKYIIVSLVDRHPKSEKLRRVYEELGFSKDCETYIAKL